MRNGRFKTIFLDFCACCVGLRNLLFRRLKVAVLACETYCFGKRNNRFRNVRGNPLKTSMLTLACKE